MSIDGRPARVRAPRRGSTPTLSIVVSSRSDRQDLEACLGTLLPRCTPCEAEVIVVRAAGASEVASLGRAYPAARFIQAPHDATARQLRGIGMAEATGDIVALANESSGMDAAWMCMLLRQAGAQELPPAERAAVDWDRYFAEQGLFAGLGSGERAS